MVRHSPRAIEIKFLERLAVWISHQPPSPYYLLRLKCIMQRLDYLYAHRYWKRPTHYQQHIPALHNSRELGHRLKVQQKDIRITLPELRDLAHRLQASEAFQPRGKKLQARVDVQLACFLFKLGNKGMSNYQVAQKFGLCGKFELQVQVLTFRGRCRQLLHPQRRRDRRPGAAGDYLARRQRSIRSERRDSSTLGPRQLRRIHRRYPHQSCQHAGDG
jgi:hypothetical protein